jgi:hypothetical protein
MNLRVLRYNIWYISFMLPKELVVTAVMVMF